MTTPARTAPTHPAHRDSGPSPIRRRRRHRRRTAAALAGSVLAGSLAAGLASIGPAPAGAADEAKLSMIQVCDASGCLHAWRVVDSDGDGVSDADELVAGTDPYDRASSPPLRHLVELATDRRLPSFEAGLATFVVLPADLVAAREKGAEDPALALSLEGFPLPARKDALSRMGISSDVVKELGVDLDHGGFTIGLDHATKDGGRPPIRVGGIDVGLISDDTSSDHDPTPTTAPAPPTSAATPSTTPDSTPDSTPATSAIPGPQSSGGAGVTDDSVDANGVRTIRYADGSVEVYGAGFGYEKGADGGTKWFWVVTHPSKGLFNSLPRYDNPDADGTGVDPAQVEAWKKVSGSTKRTAEGWRQPKGDGDPTRRSGALVAHVESDLAMTAIVVDVPRVTTAQPEGRGDLPNPRDAAPRFGGGGGGCSTKGCGG